MIKATHSRSFSVEVYGYFGGSDNAIFRCMNGILLNELSSIDRAIYSLKGPFLELGGPLSPEALGRLPTLPKAKAGSACHVQ